MRKRKKVENYNYWTPALEGVLRMLYPTYTSQHVANIMGMTLGAINSRATQLGLKKDPQFKSEIRSYTMKQLVNGSPYRFPKGHVPQNKGKKMPAETRNKVEHTFFKKGNKPHNTKFDGYERINRDGYTEIRVAERKFIGKHRLIWEEHNGPIPEGYIVIFADGNRTNFAIENLLCVSRGDHAILNKNRKYGPEIAQNILLLCKLKNQLKTQN